MNTDSEPGKNARRRSEAAMAGQAKIAKQREDRSTLIVIWTFLAIIFGAAASSRAAGPGAEIKIVEIQGTAEIMTAGGATWVLTQTNQVLHPHDKLRLGK